MDWTLAAGLGSLTLLALVAVFVAWRWYAGPRAGAVDGRGGTGREAGVAVAAAAPVSPAGPDDPGSPASVLGELFRHALGRDGAGEPLPTSAHVRIETEAAATLRTIVSNPRYLPRRPQLLPQLLQAVNDDDSSLRDIGRIIGRDPALTGNLLRIANSPAYRVQPEPVESIDRAVALLGTLGIRSTIAAALLQPVLSSGGAFGQFPEIIWNHSLRAAIAAEAHAALICDDDPFAAQLLGLLHGLGSIVVFRVARDLFAAHPATPPSAASIVRLLESQAGPAASQIAASWDLSERIVAALGQQQEPVDPAQWSPLARSLRFGRVAAALAMLVEAGRLGSAQALAQLPERQQHPAQVERIWERLTRPVSPTGP